MYFSLSINFPELKLNLIKLISIAIIPKQTTPKKPSKTEAPKKAKHSKEPKKSAPEELKDQVVYTKHTCIIYRMFQKRLLLEIKEIYHSGIEDYDSRLVFIPINTVQSYFALDDSITGWMNFDPLLKIVAV